MRTRRSKLRPLRFAGAAPQCGLLHMQCSTLAYVICGAGGLEEEGLRRVQGGYLVLWRDLIRSFGWVSSILKKCFFDCLLNCKCCVIFLIADVQLLLGFLLTVDLVSQLVVLQPSVQDIDHKFLTKSVEEAYRRGRMWRNCKKNFENLYQASEK
jgi:hypothetical protein